MDNLVQLNPQVKEVIIGIKKFREIKIYPLSLADQTKLTSLIATVFVKLIASKDSSNVEFIQEVRTVLEENICEILSIVTEEDGRELAKEITNEQIADIIEILYDVNYGVLEKKVKGLIEKIRKQFLPKRSLPTFSENTPNIDLKTSLDEVFEKED